MFDTLKFPTRTRLLRQACPGNGTNGIPCWCTTYLCSTAPDFRCERCSHYGGGVTCDLNIFVLAAGCDMSACWGFEEGKKGECA